MYIFIGFCLSLFFLFLYSFLLILQCPASSAFLYSDSLNNLLRLVIRNLQFVFFRTFLVVLHLQLTNNEVRYKLNFCLFHPLIYYIWLLNHHATKSHASCSPSYKIPLHLQRPFVYIWIWTLRWSEKPVQVACVSSYGLFLITIVICWNWFSKDLLPISTRQCWFFQLTTLKFANNM